ncbi:MAG: carboxymuconolactone decarboxylase family protein [Actinomycetota bacterium]|nr:carboxymuconolactone decarboxylase family protein [Actinomycetota bacterium]
MSTNPSNSSPSERLSAQLPDELSGAQRALYDSIVAGPRAAGPQRFALVDAQGRLNGPFGPLLVQPQLGAAVSALGETIRYGTQLTDREREIAILLVATACRSEFEWYAHARIGRHVGLDDEQLGALAAGHAVPVATEREAAVVQLVGALLDNRPIDDAQYASAHSVLGEVGVFETACLVGYYRLLAGVIDAFAVGVPDDAEPSPWRET